MASALTVVLDKVDKTVAGIVGLAGTRVMVGVPAEKALRKPDERVRGQPINNAALAYIHENGAPEAKIPPRPFLLPGVKIVQPEIEKGLRAAAEHAFDGKPDASERDFHRVGLRAQAAVRRKIQSGPFLPLAPATILARIARGRRGQVSSYLQAKRERGEIVSSDIHVEFSGMRPLIDTGALRNSINYVVRKVSWRN